MRTRYEDTYKREVTFKVAKKEKVETSTSRSEETDAEEACTKFD
jgi:hypothetical protein